MTIPDSFTARPAATITFTFIDGGSARATLSLNITSDTPIAEAHAAAQAAAAQLAVLIEGYSISYSAVQVAPSAPATTEGNARGAHKGVLAFRTASAKPTSVQIPAILPHVVRSDHNLDAAQLQPLVALLTAAPFCISNGARLTSLASATEEFRRWSVHNERQRAVGLVQEAEIALELIETGLAILQRSKQYHTRHFSFLLLLSSGLERLMKVMLILRAEATDQPYLSQDDLKSLGHDLKKLRTHVSEKCFTSEYLQQPHAQRDQDFLTGDETLDKMFTVLSDFARQERYAYLNVIVEPKPWEEGPPDVRWGHLEFAQTELDEFWTLFQSNDEALAKQQNVHQLVITMEQCIRAFARLFPRNVLGTRGKSIGTARALLNFARLEDAQLGTRQYTIEHHA